MPTNQLLANRMFTLSADGVCGVSLMAASAIIRGDDSHRQGKFVVMVTTLMSTAPVHVHPRVTFTDATGTCATVVHTQYFTSNAQAYGGSAVLGQGLVLVPSAQNVAVFLDGVAGSALQVWLLTASNTASSTPISGAVAIWRV